MSQFSLAQDLNQKELLNSYRKNFEQPIESLFLHLNKETFIAGEKMYFSAYLLDLKEEAPLSKSSILHVGIYDSIGNQINSSYWEISQGVSHGSMELPSEHGKYFLKASTDRMRKYGENHSIVKEVSVLEYETSSDGSKGSNISVIIKAEGNHVISDLINTIGFHCLDSKGGGVEIVNGEIRNSKGNIVLQNLHSDKFGFGKFDLFLKKGEDYYCSFVTKEGLKLERKIDRPADHSFALNVTGNSNKRIISIRANDAIFTSKKNNKFFLVIHRMGNIKIIPFELDNPVKSFSLGRNDLFTGVNAISLLDGDKHLIAERIIFNPVERSKIEFDTRIERHSNSRDSLYLVIKPSSGSKTRGKFSLSLTTNDYEGESGKGSIVETLLVSPFVNLSFPFDKNFVLQPTRQSFSTMDLLLLLYGRDNFHWDKMDSIAPSNRGPYEEGFSISGQVNHKKLDKIKSIVMYQDQILEMNSAEIDVGGNFSMTNLKLDKDKDVHFSLLTKKDKMEKPDLKVLFSPEVRSDSLHPTFIEQASLSINNETASPIRSKPLIDKNRVQLEEITLKVAPEEELPSKNQKLLKGIWNADKISERDVEKKRMLSNYLRSVGFKVEIFAYTNWLFVRPRSSSRFKIQNPVIYMDGFRLNEPLRDYPLFLIDEIYYEHVGIMESNGGTIFIYLKDGANIGNRSTSNFTSIAPTTGFDSPSKYVNILNQPDQSGLLDKYICLLWKANVNIIPNEEIYIPFHAMGKTTFNYVIEGIAEEGSLISKSGQLELEDD